MSTMPQAPVFSHRYLMVDYARGRCVHESFVAKLLEEAQRLGVSGLAVYIEDLVPFIGGEANETVTPEGWQRLDVQARAMGLQLLPLLNLSGHSEQTLAHEAYAGLRGNDRGDVLDYSLPETKRFVSLALDRVMEVFTSPLIHVGFDEAWGLGQREERRAGRALDVATLFRRDLCWVASEVMARGRRPMCWGDVPGIYHPEVIPDLPRELIPVDWFYRVEPTYPSMTRWREAGFEFWVAPTTGFAEPGWPDPVRLARHARAVLAAGAEAGASGVIYTAWEQPAAPYRTRLPIAAWQVAQSRAPHQPVSYFEVGQEWWAKECGVAMGLAGLRASRALGAAARLLPEELPHQNPLRVREVWHQRHPGARRTQARLARLLAGVEPLVSGNAELELAFREMAFWRDLLSPDALDTARLRGEAAAICAEQRAVWSRERAPEAYDRLEAPRWQARMTALEEPAGAAPAWRARELLLPSSPPVLPQITTFHERKGWEGVASPEEEPTRVALWSDGEAFCARFECSQRLAPVRGVERSVDFCLTRDDAVALCLDPQGRGDGFLWIIANAAGRVFCQWHNRANQNSQWHPLAGEQSWAVPQEVEGGWGVALRIPYRELGITPPQPGHRLGLTLQRYWSWGHGATSLWGGLGWLNREAPPALESIIL